MKRTLFLSSLVFSTLGLTAPAHAENGIFDFNQLLSSKDYENIVRPFVSLSRFQFLSSPSSLAGNLLPVGLSVGIGSNYAKLSSTSLDTARQYVPADANYPTFLVLPRLMVQVGTPFGVDLALNYATIPGTTGIQMIGVGAQYSFFNSSESPISLAVRTGYSRVFLNSALNSYSVNGEVLVGAPLFFAEPYVGAGINRAGAKSEFNITVDDPNIGKINQSVSQSADWTEAYFMIGSRFTIIPLIGLDIEAQLAPKQTQLSAQISFHI